MTKRRILWRSLFLFICLTPCYAYHMAVVVNKSNRVQNLTSANLARIFKLDSKKWPDGTNVVLVLHKDSADELATLGRLNRMTPSELQAFLASHKDSIRIVDSDADVIEAVAATPGGVGFVYERSINDRISVVKVDGKLPLEAGYLSH